MSTDSIFSEYARYYDLLYIDKDYTGEVDYVHRLIQRWRPGAKSVLEFGSGTGRHASLLADAGYLVQGIERSSEMLASADRRAKERLACEPAWFAPTFSLGDIRTARVPRTFDAVISLFHVISYQVSNDDLMAALRMRARILMSTEFSCLTSGMDLRCSLIALQ